ncbi:PAS/PAC sensor signal transduction histidine kinase [Chitinophaga sp. CF118]|uniref:PAS domain-containing protein n=1 Tax=Chitinophaga sp. CF118 TaxID=1884367 RepID=UPI0008E9B3F3|nr:PAS domain-containing protein [Chitinophaga sp. CF118]SFD22929.1 PAS/PAC sensor signal transduction histidine kinase [Chitinophaga sp. CF118]
MNTNNENASAEPDNELKYTAKYVSRLEAIIEGQVYVLEMISRNIPIQEVLEGIIAWVEGNSEGELLASILLTDKENKTLLHGAAPSLPDYYNAAVNGIPVAYGEGSCGTAAFLKEQVIVDDIATNPLWKKYTALTTKAGLGACWSTPLIGKQGNLLGTFAMYFKTPRKPTENDLHIIRLVGRTIIIAIEHNLVEGEKQCLQLNEHITAQKILEERQNFYQLLMDVPAVIAVLSGPDHIYELANKIYMQTFGVTRQIIGKTIKEVLPELEAQGIYKLLDEVYNTGEPIIGYEQEIELDRSRTGIPESVYLNFIYQPIRDHAGNISQILIHAIDVTQSVKERQRAEKNEEQFRSFVLNAPIPIGIYIGREMRIQTVNEAILQTWEKDESVIGKTFREALPELEGQPFFDKLDNVFMTGESYEAVEEKVLLMRNGKLSTTYYSFTYKALRDRNGQIYGVMNTALEVTEQVIAKQKLAEAEYTLRNAIEVAKLGTWQTNPLTGETTFSERIKEWYGGAPDEPLTFEQAMQCMSDPSIINNALVKALMPESDGIINVEYEIIHAVTGQHRIIHTVGKVFFDDTGKPYLIVGTSQDITAQKQLQIELETEVQERTRELSKANQELKEANQNLERVNKNLEQFAYVTSHDLQEPLRKIKIFSDILQTRSEVPLLPFTKKYVDKIDASVNRMSALITDLLNFSRIEKSCKIFIPTNLNAVIEEVIEDFELAIKDKQVILNVSPLLQIEAVPLEMRQLFFNLIGNAIKFSRQNIRPVININGRILTAEEVANDESLNSSWPYYAIEVSDNGIGFDSRYADKIFTIFQRLHNRELYSGTGIGLALCQQVAINHHGKIFAEGIENKGARFFILLPIHR